MLVMGGELGHVDDLDRIAGRSSEKVPLRRSMRLEVLHVHVTGEGINGRLDAAVAVDGAVDDMVKFWVCVLVTRMPSW